MVDLVTGDLPQYWLDAATKASIIGADIETSGLDKKNDRIACIQIYVPNVGTVMVRTIDEEPYRLAALLESYRITKVFHYAPFDVAFLLRDYPFIDPVKIVDTKLAADVLDPKREIIKNKHGEGSHRLEALIYYYFEYQLDKTLSVSNWFAPKLSTDQLQYAEDDVRFLPQLLNKIETDIIDSDIQRFHLLAQRYTKLPDQIRKSVQNGEAAYAYS